MFMPSLLFTKPNNILVMDSGEVFSYQSFIQKNIEENKRVLQSLGFSFGTLSLPKEKVSRPKSNVRKSSSKSQSRHSVVQDNLLPIRRQTRHSSSFLQSVEFDDSADLNNDEENTPPQKKKRSEAVFGKIEGVSVGDWWSTRIECSAAGVHRPTVAGIHGKQSEGCYSIALSGGYEDDLDCGTYFTYTGCGGRDLKGTKCNPKNLRTAPQTKDQVFDGLNAALASNIESKKPVRVIRGFKLQSDFAPEEGYRYDGLYSVEKYWTATGLSGFKVYKFALKRLEDQDPPPWERCAEAEPPFIKELPSAEANTSNTYVHNMETRKSTSPHLCAPKQLFRNSPRDRQRKQTSPQRICQIDDTDELAQSFLSEISDALEDESEIKNVSSEETLKSTENIQHSENHPKISIKNDNNIVRNKRPNCLPDKLQTSFSISSEKKVRFSPKIEYANREDCEHKQSEMMQDNMTEDYTELQVSSYSDGKKQATILNYFSPIKKPVENHSSKNTVNPKSLRGNRLPVINLSYARPNCDSESHLKNHTDVPSKSTTESVCMSNCVKSIGYPQNLNKSSSHKRKYSSSLPKHKELDLDSPTLSLKGPSLMENLIKQNSEKLRKRKLLSALKPCSVVLKRIEFQDCYQSENGFVGWDIEGTDFHGFNTRELTETQRRYENFKRVINNYKVHNEDGSEKQLKLGFHGWDSNKDEFQGSSGLVPIAFIIDKLSKS